ncbi:hypothetical protein TNIN_25961 [Trichonephila inaurata madagascariensis]|uniref:Uncharacterized protein n=1 Tax=Trichonephila inaurata madagascariensis TaxID=2747483 RepID=A0A8X6WLE0_9ARAC|nr:hypothetical protein TNIN_25961 [Trichonephila inaurata madagascariensis]
MESIITGKTRRTSPYPTRSQAETRRGGSSNKPEEQIQTLQVSDILASLHLLRCTLVVGFMQCTLHANRQQTSSDGQSDEEQHST